MMSFHQSKSQEANLDPTPPCSQSTDQPGPAMVHLLSKLDSTSLPLPYLCRNESPKTWPITSPEGTNSILQVSYVFIQHGTEKDLNPELH